MAQIGASHPEVSGSVQGEFIAPPKAPRWAWTICWLMFASTVLNYMDRQAIALVNPRIRAEFHIDQEGFGWILASFYLMYALFQVPAGYLTDRWNVRWAYAGAVAWWSLAGIATAFSPTLGALMAFRALLGIGESFNWPCALRVTATILPPSDRSLGNGIFNSGAAVGAIFTPLIVPPLATYFGWRVSFVLLGSLGFVWFLVWLVALRGARAGLFTGRAASTSSAASGRPAGLSWQARGAFALVAILAVTTAIVGFRWIGLPAIWWGIALVMIGPLLIARVLSREALAGADWAASLGQVVRLRRFWVLVVVSVSVNVCWHFLVNWMATFFQVDRRLGLLAGGMVSALPFLAADVGNLAGGGLSRALVRRRGLAPESARIWVVAAGTLLITSGVWVGRLHNDALIVTLLGLMALGAAAFMANYFAFCQEVDPRHTGLVVGILGGLGNLFAAGFMPIAGRIKDTTGDFGLDFLIVGLLPVIGLVALVLGWGWSSESPEARAEEATA